MRRGPMGRGPIRGWVPLMMVLALVVAACGDDDDDGAEAPATTAGGEEPAATTTASTDETPATTAAPTDDTPATTAAGEEPTGEPILIGVLSDLSGPTGDVGTPYSEGIRGYIEWRNSQGGVGGRPLEALWEDYQYDVAIAERLYTDYVSQGVVAIQGWGTADTEALRARINADEIPFMSASYSAELIDPSETPYNFVPATSYSDQMRIALRWIAEQDPDAEVAVFHHDSPFGTSPVGDGESYIAEQGLDLGYEAYVMPSGATDFIGELQRVQDQGASYIVVQNVESPAAVLAQNIQEQGLDIQLVLLNWAAGEIFLELAGDAAEGAIGVQPWSPATRELDGQADARAYLEGRGESLEDHGLHFTQAWWTMDVMAKALETLVEAGEEVTGPNLRDALEALDPVDTGGVSAEPVEFSADSHAGMECSTVYEVQSGVWEPLADELCP
jgi:branched-chain amino acid transport system substrate-binding protein